MRHEIVHYLDVARHFLAYAFEPYNFVTNLSASVITAAFLSLLYPPVRRAAKGFVIGHVEGLHRKLDDQHKERMEQAERHHAEHLVTLANNHQAVLKALKPKPVKATAPVKKVGGTK